MMLRTRDVAVKQLPETPDRLQRELLFRELESCMNVDHPYVVLDCSMLSQMDGAAIYLLLCCLEEAMKRNGDVRLAALTSNAMESLELAGVGALFQIFHSITEAVDSFSRPSIRVVAHVCMDGSPQQASENAA